MTITGSNTTNFGFQKLGSNDDAGYSTINEVVDGVDTILNASDRLLKAGLTPTTGYTVKWDGADWISGTLDSAGIATSAIIADKIATGAVTSDKILDGTIAIGDLAFDPATQTELNDHASDTTSVHGITDTSTLALKSGNTYTGTHDYTGATLTGTASLATSLAGGSAASVPYQSATGVTAMLANGTAGQVLTSGGTSVAPSWQATSIGEANIATNAVTEDKIASNAVTQAKMADDSVGTAEIIDSNVTYAKLASDAKSFDVPTSGDGTGVYFTATGDFTSASLSTASAQNPVVISAASSPILLNLPNTVGTEGATITVCQTGTGAVTIKPKVDATATINGSTSTTYLVGGQYSVVTLLCLSNSGSNGTWIITGDYT